MDQAIADADTVLLPTTDAQRKDTLRNQFWIWCGANVAPINWVLGALGVSMGLSLADTLLVLIAGNVLGMTVFGFFVLLGQRTGLTGMMLARGVFGRRGNYLPATIQMIVVAGWCAVNTWIILDLVMALLGKLGAVDPSAPNHVARILVAAVIMAVQVLISFFGHRVISTFERWTVPPTLVILLAMSVVAWGVIHVDWHYAGIDGVSLHGRARWLAMSQVMTAIGIGWGLTWLTYAGDYSRFVPRETSRAKTYTASAVGQLIPVVWLGVLGATMATKSGSVDPGAMIVDTFGAMALPVLLLVIHGPIATNILNVYSFSVTAQALDLRVSRRVMSVVVGIISMAGVVGFIYAGDLASSMDSWLSGMVGWTTTWGAMMFVHHYVLDRHTRDFSDLCTPVGSGRVADINWRAIAAFGGGVVATWLFMYGMVPALQGPVAKALGGLDLSWLAGSLTSGLLYWLLMRGRAVPMVAGRRLSTLAAPVVEEGVA